jgi:4-amino-4-deoxy-L-arabinose transferase-like glycosyltransferase
MKADGNSHLVPAQTSVQDRRFCRWLLVASLAVNVAVVLLTRQHETIASIDNDEREYWDIATDFQHFGMAGIPARRTPPFPILIATLRSIVGNDYLHVQLALSILLAFSPILVYCLVHRRVGDARVAKLASIGFLLWPPFVRYGATLYSDSIGLFIFLGYLLAYPLTAARGVTNFRRRWMQFVIAGALLSFCVLMKPLYLIYVPFAVGFAIAGETSIRRRLYAACFLIAGYVMVALPWATYISARESRLIPVSTNDGETLAGGLNPALLSMDKNSVIVTNDGRTAWLGPGKWLPMERTGYLSAQELQFPYAKRRTLLIERTYAWIKSHPAATTYLTARKLSYMWGIYPFWNGAAQSFLGSFPLLLLTCAALLSLWINRQALAELALFWTLPLFSSAVCLVSWGSWRFRMPADVGLIVLSAILAANWKPVQPLWRRLIGGRSRTLERAPIVD